MTTFPRTTVGGVSLPRMLIGTNWILGYSHTSQAADDLIRSMHAKKEAIADVIGTYLKYGVDAIMAPISANPHLVDAIKLAEDRSGQAVTRIDTPIINVDNTAAGRREAEKTLDQVKAAGAKFCLIHHSSAEQLVNKNTETLDRLPDYLSMIRDRDMLPGLSAHMPELIIYSDKNNYDVETYIQLYNCMGFLMQVEVEYIHRVIQNAKKPVMTIKAMAAGRVSPFVGLTFAWHTIRPQDMVTVGCLTPQEVEEDIEISLAALEGRSPNLEGRSSPNKTSIMTD